MTAANALTLGRFLCAPIVFVAGGHKLWAICLTVYAIGLLSDLLDGRLARATHSTTPFGRAMDSAADKALVAAAMLALTAAGRLPVWLVFLFIVREFAVFGLRAIRPRNGVTVAEIADKIGRLRFCIMHVGIVAILFPVTADWLRLSGLCMVALATYLAYAGLVFYVIRDWPTLRGSMRKYLE